MMLVALLAFQSILNNSDYQRGIEFFQQGRLDAAVPFLMRATEALPRDARTWKALGVAYAAQGMHDRAEPPFRRACEIDPKCEDACYYYGRALYALNRFEPSLAVLRQAAATDPKSWKIRLGIAQAREALGQAEKAEQEFQKTLSLSRSGDPKPGVAYGLFLIRQGRFEEAIAPLEEVIKRFPGSAEAHIHLGRALLEQGKALDAIPHLERAVALEPVSAQAHLLLAKAYVRAARSAEAQPHFDAAAGLLDSAQL